MRCSTHTDFIEDLALGTDYENFIYDLFLRKWGVKIVPYVGKEAQRKGENNKGLEIKFDRNLYTGNLYIETADKVDGSGGIYRQGTNTKYLLIGDKTRFWVFDIQVLREAHTAIDTESVEWLQSIGADTTDCWKYRRTGNPKSNSKAYLMTQEDGHKLCKMYHVV